jgi:hypothetical protein
VLRRERRPDVASCRGLRGQLAHLGAGAVHPINSNSIPRRQDCNHSIKALFCQGLYNEFAALGDIVSIITKKERR